MTVIFLTSLMKSFALWVFDVTIYTYLVKWSTRRHKYFLVDREPPKPPIVSMETNSNGFVAGRKCELSPNLSCPLDLFFRHTVQPLHILVIFFVRLLAKKGINLFCICLVRTRHMFSYIFLINSILNFSDKIIYSFFSFVVYTGFWYKLVFYMLYFYIFLDLLWYLILLLSLQFSAVHPRFC